jgi:hypothetical protein
LHRTLEELRLGLRDGQLRVTKAAQGPRADALIRHTKNRSAEWRELWNGELIRWIEWRLAQATAEARLRGDLPPSDRSS